MVIFLVIVIDKYFFYLECYFSGIYLRIKIIALFMEMQL